MLASRFVGVAASVLASLAVAVPATAAPAAPPHAAALWVDLVNCVDYDSNGVLIGANPMELDSTHSDVDEDVPPNTSRTVCENSFLSSDAVAITATMDSGSVQSKTLAPGDQVTFPLGADFEEHPMHLHGHKFWPPLPL
ncbi:hypothetical protein ABZY31_24190 [Streptomyces sp. NPDC006529]|uniref:hypothetical protein n=1 Tax=Streptomyces sp. NPDC006529 TaxID=3157177 RepID=UPI0033A8DA31